MAKGTLKKFRKGYDEDYADKYERKYAQRQRTFNQRLANAQRELALDNWKAEQQ